MTDKDGETPPQTTDEAEPTRRTAMARLGLYGAVTGAVLLGVMSGEKAPAASISLLH